MEINRKRKTRNNIIQGGCWLLAIMVIIGCYILDWIEGSVLPTHPCLLAYENVLSDPVWGAVIRGCGVVFTLLVLIKGIKGDPGAISTSDRRRWKFVVIGILFGIFGVHLAYAKRWLLFLLLWFALIIGNVFVSSEGSDFGEGQPVATALHGESAKRDASNPIDSICVWTWALLWIGGTLFIKKDGNGRRM